MMTVTMKRQLKICEIIIICLLTKTVLGKTLTKLQDQINKQKVERFKRGYSHYGGNEFGSSSHVSSGVLQYSDGDEYSISSDSSSLDGSLGISSLSEDYANKHSAGSQDPWPVTGISSGYDIWLEALPDYHAISKADLPTAHTSFITSKHPGSDHIVNTVFSDNSMHPTHLELPKSELHTQIGSSTIGASGVHIGSSSFNDHSTLAISDNLDFKNDDGLTKKHYFKSYGK